MEEIKKDGNTKKRKALEERKKGRKEEKERARGG